MKALLFKHHLLIGFAFVAACGGSPKPTTGTAGGAEPKLTPPPADMAFKDMNADQRMAYMKLTVVPEMKPLFQEFNPTKFAEFGCKTCHGKGAKDGSFEMPNPDLEKLPKPEDFMKFAGDPKHGPWVQFMAMKVKPRMAKLLKLPEFDPQTNTGEFSCHACHLTEGESPTTHHK